MKKEEFKNIIGYEKEKQTLKRIIDILNNTEKYKKIGSSIPHGLLMYGVPGTGKTTMAKEFIRCVNRKSFIVRKTKSDGSFIEYIKEIFDKAKKCQPSIILLDDLDKFSVVEGKSENQEEYVVVQSCIDEINESKEDVFIFATANNIYSLPISLRRTGRFDIKMEILNPKEKDVYEICKYYLTKKKIDNNINIRNISYILTNSNCSDLEKVCNQAGIYAAYNNKEKIEMEELVRAALENVYKDNLEECNVSNEYDINVAYHEAGHALIGELLEPGSVSFITIMLSDSHTKGVTKYHENENYYYDIKYTDNRVKTLLAGKAATEIVYKTCDTGSSSDLNKAYDIVCSNIFDDFRYNFDDRASINFHESDEVTKSYNEKTSEIITKYYNEVKELLIINRDKLDKLANNLYKKKILFKNEIK